ncbi:MAG: hypothetical protein D6694_07305 [Gammaproteobacteria bacterium]|nr:MAG: hypothetical protein D6694_07305 [Gammaproteobacteria bacterium]
MAQRSVSQRITQVFLVSLLIFSFAAPALAGPREQARRLHDRIAGVPPSQATLDAMAADIQAGNPISAAMRAIEHPNFYNVTLKNWITPWTNEDQTVFAPLNDYTATVIGIIRDGVDFREVLSGDILYVGNSSLGLPPYSVSNNDHYEALENNHIDLKANLVRTTQSSVTGLPASATAGIITTRAAAKAFFIAGTNRAMFRFLFINYMCTDLEPLKDITRPPDRIRQDVTRSPGGDSRIFLNNCIGCHAGMDPMAQAFAYYDYQYDSDNDPNGDNGRLVYNAEGMLDPITGSRVQAKYHINANNFKPGYVTPNDHWDNYWRQGPNQRLGWSASLPGSGDGAKSLGQELANSEAFAQCQVKKVFQAMCLRPPQDASDRTEVANLVATFKSSGYDLKQVFAGAAVYCMGE